MHINTCMRARVRICVLVRVCLCMNVCARASMLVTLQLVPEGNMCLIRNVLGTFSGMSESEEASQTALKPLPTYHDPCKVRKTGIVPPLGLAH